MIRISKSGAHLIFSKDAYSRESLEEAAQVLGKSARVFLEDAGRERRVVIRPPQGAKGSSARLRALAGVFADAALNHAYRQKVVRFHGKLSAALLSVVFERGFKAVPADPLEELEPQVLRDRDRDAEALLDQARRLEGA